jgi:CubicO group peptidase (beta-lactamase class C family)
VKPVAGAGSALTNSKDARRMSLAPPDTAFVCATEAAQRLLAPWAAQDGPGGAVVLFDAAGPRQETYAGFASIANRTPLGPDTALRYASLSKHMLAALLLQSGLDLERPLGDSLPELRPALAGVPLSRALDVTGGLPDLMETAWLLGVPFTAEMDRAALLAFTTRLSASNYPVGTEFSYSNTG